MKKFAVFDIDGTLVRWQLYHAIGDALARHKYISAEAFADVKNARMHWKRREHQDAFVEYEQTFIAAFDKAMQAVTPAKFDAVAREVFEEYKDQVYAYTREQITALKQQGYLLFAISGSPSNIVQLVADYYGFDDFVGSVYEHDGAHYTGKKTITAHKKHEILKQLVEKHAADYTHSIGFGDSQGDISMLELVDRPIAFNPSRQLSEHAQQAGWQIVIERKNVIYKLVSQNGQYVLA